MDAVETAGATHGAEDGRKHVALVVAGYLSAVLLPLFGMLVGILIVASPPSRWARKQGVAIIVLSGVLITFGIGLGPMLTDSYFAGKAKSELNAVSQETQRADEQSLRQMEAEQAKSRKEYAAIQAHIGQLQAGGRR